MSFITEVYLLCIQAIAVYSQVKATQTCSNKETRMAAINEALTHRGCEDYNCGEFIISTLHLNNYDNVAITTLDPSNRMRFVLGAHRLPLFSAHIRFN